MYFPSTSLHLPRGYRQFEGRTLTSHVGLRNMMLRVHVVRLFTSSRKVGSTSGKLRGWGGVVKLLPVTLLSVYKGRGALGENDYVELIFPPPQRFVPSWKAPLTARDLNSTYVFVSARAAALALLRSLFSARFKRLACLWGAFKTRTLTNDPGVHRC